ncbi:uncharacterized protein LOC141911976 [Tubulanus polymorphus]|uniref:uncharacterized protein LOC141911976 n=1 Tax=Tubulanus polymorphus TaxID=672921 RepID=UPI003DA41A29
MQLFSLKIFLFCTFTDITTGLQCHHCGYYTRLPEELAHLWHLNPVTADCLTPHQHYMRPCFAGFRCAEAATSWRDAKMYERWCVPPVGCMSEARLQTLITSRFDSELRVERYRCCDENGCNNNTMDNVFHPYLEKSKIIPKIVSAMTSHGDGESPFHKLFDKTT